MQNTNTPEMAWGLDLMATNDFDDLSHFTQTGGQFDQLLPSNSLPTTGSFNSNPIYTSDTFPSSTNNFTDYGGQTFGDNNPGTLSPNGSGWPISESLNNTWTSATATYPFTNAVDTNSTPQSYPGPYSYSQFPTSFPTEEQNQGQY
jgi:hypothetical protein